MNISKFLLPCLICFVIGCSSNTAKEDTSASITNPETSWDGKTIFATCIICHGENAQGNQSLGAPSLSHQERWYLQRQLNNFKNSIRGADPKDSTASQMAAIAKTLQDEAAIEAVIDHIKTLTPIKPNPTIKGNPIKGKAHYDRICGACHGPGGKGIESLNAPRLAGADDWYLVSQFRKFASGERGSHPDDIFGAQMQMMSKTLTGEDDIIDIAAYIQSIEK